MPYKTCRHIKENGNFCQSPALSKRDYCYYHHEHRARRLKMARALHRREQWWLDLPAIEDLRSCQAATIRVIEATYAGLVEPAVSKVLISGLRLVASNFRSVYGWESDREYAPNTSSPFLTADPGFEARHDLPPGLDLDADPLKLFPLPVPHVRDTGSVANVGANSQEPVPQVRDLPLGANLGAILRKAETPVPGSPMHVTADDVEIWDIMNREGPDEAAKRAGEMARETRRRERRLQRARYEEIARNRNIQLAAEQMLRDQQAAAKAASQQPTQQTAQPQAGTPQAAAPQATALHTPHAGFAGAQVAPISGQLLNASDRKPPQPEAARTTAEPAAGSA